MKRSPSGDEDLDSLEGISGDWAASGSSSAAGDSASSISGSAGGAGAGVVAAMAGVEPPGAAQSGVPLFRLQAEAASSATEQKRAPRNLGAEFFKEVRKDRSRMKLRRRAILFQSRPSLGLRSRSG